MACFSRWTSNYRTNLVFERNKYNETNNGHFFIFVFPFVSHNKHKIGQLILTLISKMMTIYLVIGNQVYFLSSLFAKFTIVWIMGSWTNNNKFWTVLFDKSFESTSLNDCEKGFNWMSIMNWIICCVMSVSLKWILRW